MRDGGYYNSWDFPIAIIGEYLQAMTSAGVDFVELGLRSCVNNSFKGAAAYTTDEFISSLEVPNALKVAVMVNASELVKDTKLEVVLEELFPNVSASSPVDVVRIACHTHEFVKALPAANWLKSKGYMVGFNLMQIADRTQEEVEALAREASKYDIDALYFADSMGSMDPEQCIQIIRWLRTSWDGALGIHTHDNMGKALQNTIAALDNGVTWLDATVTGMGRGPGNARTEELAIEIADRRGVSINMVPLMSIIRSYFQPLKNACGWGSNPYYYLSGKYGIHPTYIQEMLSDNRFSEEDILAVIELLRKQGGKNFSLDTLYTARNSVESVMEGDWDPVSLFEGKDVLLLGTGAGVEKHRKAIETYILKRKPIVAVLNTQSAIDSDLISVRFACHPVRMLADCSRHAELPQPLIAPTSSLSPAILDVLSEKTIYNFGLEVDKNGFKFGECGCKSPTSLVMAYAFATLASGKANRILLAGFDGYESGDPRNEEMNSVVKTYQKTEGAVDLVAVTPTRYDVNKLSIYGM
nr:aldolase catalytic domain-containing protein [Alteromonas profundi]